MRNDRGVSDLVPRRGIRGVGGITHLVLRVSGSIIAIAIAQSACAQDAAPAGSNAGRPDAAPAVAAQAATAIEANTTPAVTSQENDRRVNADLGANEDDAQTNGGDIVVTGIRKSLATAQLIKRDANTVVDAITASDIGSLPDRSINEALQRVPGVAITRFAAPNDSAHFSVQGSGVTVRGLNYVRSEFNGRDIFSASSGRGLGFDDVPAELAGSVNVYKNLTADMIEGGIAGTVSVNTRKPFDSDKRVLFLSAGLNGGDLAQRSAPQFVGLASNQWNLSGGGRIGILVGGSYSQQYSRADSLFLNSFQPRFNAPDTGDGYSCSVGGKIINQGQPYAIRVCDSFPTPAGLSQVYTPLGAGIREQDFKRERSSINASLQFENASRNLQVTAEYIRSYFEERWTERTIESDNWFSDAGKIFPAGYLNQLGFPYDPNAQFSYDDRGVFTAGTLVHAGYYPYGCTPLADASCNYTQFVPGGITTKLSNRSATNEVKTQDFSLKVNWSPTTKLHLALDGQYTKSNVGNSDDAINMNTFTDVSIDLRGKYPAVDFLTPGFNRQDYITGGQGIYYRSAVENKAISDGDEYAVRGDLTYDVSEDSFLRTVRVGGRYSERQQTVRTNAFNNWGQLSDTYATGGPNFVTNDPSLVGYFGYPNFFHGQVSQPVGAPFIRTDILENHAALMDLARKVQTAGGTFVPIEDRSGNLIDGYFQPNEVYPNTEATWAAYVMANFGTPIGDTMKLSGNVGLRYVHTLDESTGSINFATPNQVIPSNYNGNFATYCAAATSDPAVPAPALCRSGVTAAQQQATLAFANGGSITNTARNSFSHWLPSFNARLDVTSKLLFRVAASKAISRPDFDQLRNYVGVNYNSVLGGFEARSLNPYLRPVEAWQFDLTGEWYFAPVGSFTVAAFYKDLKNIVVSNQLFTRDLTNNGATLPVGVTGPTNATGHSKVKGVEVAYQQTYNFLPGPLAGFGSQLSYTYIDTGRIVIGPPGYAPSNNLVETGNQPTIDIAGLYENLPLEGLSRHNFNAALFYELGGLQARFAYSWRSRFLLTRLDCCFPFGPVWNEASGQADTSIAYSPTKNFKIVLEVQNLLNTTTKTSYAFQNDVRAPRSWFKSDRQFAISTKLTF